MKRRIDWGTWTSMLLVGAASLAIAWRFAPATFAQSDAHPGEPRPSSESPAKTNPAKPASPVAAFEHYRLEAPDRTLVLSETLDEISDLSLAPDGQSLWAVHDERGTLFRIATKDGAVVQKIEFHKKGDFEGVAVVDGKVIAGRSDGVLFVVDPANGQTTQISTALGLACNLEGLAYEPGKRRLLLSCKSPTGDKSRRGWAVYALDLTSKELQREPLFVITGRALEEYLAQHPEQRGLTSTMATQFDPSAIAIHPRSGRIYMISTRARMLVVLEPGGKLIHIEPLDRAVHPQPEGIAFLADGTLFISSEARGRHALLQQFSQLPP